MPAFEVHAAAYYKAMQVFREYGFTVQALPGDITIDGAAGLLAERQAQLLLCGTSANAYNLEHTFIEAARREGVPSLAVLDFWSNYTARFSRDGSGLAYLPDRIAVMDELAYTEMLAEGFPAERLVITGQPAFDGLAQVRASFSDEARRRTRQALDIGEDDFAVVFVSQPFATLFGRDESHPQYPGYDEHTIFCGLLAVLEELSRELRRKTCLVVRPHLREEAAWWEQISGHAVPIRTAPGIDFPELALSADLVTGMTSTKLVEAARLGRRTFSLQVGAKAGQVFDMHRLGVHRTLTSLRTLSLEIGHCLTGQSGSCDEAEAAPDGNAAARVVDLICQMAADASELDRLILQER
jgi:hypothetical protein